MSKEVVKKEEAALPAVIDFTADAGIGFEDTDSSSYAIPFLRILQATSPQCKKKDPEYVDGAEEGDFYNTVTGKIYKDGITVIPAHYEHKYNLWAPDRGGFKGTLSVAEYANCEKAILQDSKGNKYEGQVSTGYAITDTREHYLVILESDGSYSPALYAISGTEIKKSKRWMTLMQGIRIGAQIAPMFSQKYKLTTVGESNDKGSWAGVKIEHLGQVTSAEEYAAAKQFREMVRSGAAKVTDEDLPF